MKKKSVFRKIAFLLTITLVINLAVFDVFSFDSKADTRTVMHGTGEYYGDRTFNNETYDEWVFNGDTSFRDTITIKDGVTVIVEQGAHLKFGALVLEGNVNIINRGKITVLGNASSLDSLGGSTYQYNISNEGELIIDGNASFYGRMIITNSGSLTMSGSFSSGYLVANDGRNTKLYMTDISNTGLVVMNQKPDYMNKIISNSNGGKYRVGGVYYFTDDLAASLSNPDSVVTSGAYVNSMTVSAPTGWRISYSDSSTYAESSDLITVSTSQAEKTYYLYDNQNYRTEGKTLSAITIKEYGAVPTGAKYVIAGEKENGANFYWNSVTLNPPTGYSEIDLTYANNTGGDRGSSVTLSEGCYKGATVKLKDADNQWTEQSYPVEDLYVLNSNGTYYVTGEDDIREEGEDFPRYAKEAYINADPGYKVLLADEYNRLKNAGGTITGKDSIKVTSSIENPSIYVHSDNGNFWVGPISLDPIHVGMLIPETKYTLKGNKYKDKYYDSDVVLTPAEGFKVTTSKDKAATDKITFTKTTKDVKIYLVKDVVNDDHVSDGRVAYSDPINVGDIYILREGEGKVKVNDLYYGGKVIPTVESKTNDIKKVTYKYKNASGGDYLKETPSEVGKYVVEAYFDMTDDYKELVVKDEFEISYLPTPTAPYSIEGTKGENEFYTTDVKIIPAEGYRISTTIKTGYTNSIDLKKNGDLGYVYLQKISTGEMTDKIAIKEIMIDKELPVVTGISDKEVIYTDSKQIIVKDDNLEEVSVNGVKVAVSDGQAVIDLSADNGIMDYTIIMKDKAGNTSTIYVTLITAWMQSGDVQEGVPLKLYPGYTYNFPEGSTWTIEGDPTVYKGGNKFVVTNNVEIKFKKN